MVPKHIKGNLTYIQAIRFYSEAFILLLVSDCYTNITPTSNQVLPPHMPELIPSEEQHQIAQDSQQTHRALAALEVNTRRSSPANQQSYVLLRDLLETIATDNAEAYETTWIYGLVIFSILLSLGLLTVMLGLHGDILEIRVALSVHSRSAQFTRRQISNSNRSLNGLSRKKKTKVSLQVSTPFTRIYCVRSIYSSILLYQFRIWAQVKRVLLL
jgi:hypothetical protein